jgi:hypothetical protein
MREGILREGSRRSGSWQWQYADGRTNGINYEVRNLETASPSIRLSYTSTRPGGERESFNYHVELTTTQPRFGGLRWWFICPLTVNGRPCSHRVGKLYLPPGSLYFGCRHCHDLTYTSSQTHDKRVDFLRKHPEALQLMYENLKDAGVTQLGLLLKSIKV